MANSQFGAEAEELAAQYYRKKRCNILARNYRTRYGELDVVAAKDDCIIICEVKARSKNSAYAPREAVTPAKQRRIVLAATQFLQQYDYLDCPVRFDVIEVILQNNKPELTCIENAFEA